MGFADKFAPKKPAPTSSAPQVRKEDVGSQVATQEEDKQKSFVDKFGKAGGMEAKSFTDKISDPSKLVYIVRGKDRGRAAWHYVLVEPTKLREFLVVTNGGTVDVSKYGRILHSGWGEDPPEEIVKAVEEEFGF